MTPFTSLAAISRRVTQLERQQARDAFERSLPRRLEVAADACLDGTAKLFQYQLHCAEQISRTRRKLIAMTPAMVAREPLGRHGFSWQRLLAYPPDAELPETVSEAMACQLVIATRPIKQLREVSVFGGKAKLRVTADMRQSVAIDVLAVGGHEGLGLRRHIWTAADGRWWLTDQTEDYADQTLVRLNDITRTFDRKGFDVTASPLQKQLNSAGEYVASYAAVAAYVSGWIPIG